MQHKKSIQFLRKRKMLAVFPLLVIPFITLAFWALGGGKGTAASKMVNSEGLNLQLPNANIKSDENEDKLAFYTEADQESLKRAELLKYDPYYKDSLQLNQALPADKDIYNTEIGSNRSGLSLYKTGSSDQEQKIYQKIKEINGHINQSELNSLGSDKSENQKNSNSDLLSDDVNRMQQMMNMISDKQESDPEMVEINGTLDKILDIQHPQRLKDKLQERSLKEKDVVFAVSKFGSDNIISLLDTIQHHKDGMAGFYGIETKTNHDENDNAVEAVVHANQVLVNGSIIKLRLATDIYLGGALIPSGHFVSGMVSLHDERLEIEINTIRFGSSLFPVKLQGYDMDGLEGIHIPGAVSRDVVKQSADNGLQLMDITSVDPSLKGQAAAVGVNTVKNLLSRKVKQVKVMVKAGYRILLKSKNLQQ